MQTIAVNGSESPFLSFHTTNATPDIASRPEEHRTTAEAGHTHTHTHTHTHSEHDGMSTTETSERQGQNNERIKK
jgi:hypothetical protein